ncbi:MAG: DUF2628 domain-containing protein [Rickettsiales bacterium]|nr:DUF2628 domain-containing protein [Rickettsiales bacterium]
MILDSYEDKMLMAFVEKEKKFNWYKNTFARYNINGIDKFAWRWSWWAFFGGFFYLFYRKAYFYGLIYLILSIIFAFNESTSLISFILYVVAGGVSPYFVYLKYKKDKEKIEKVIKDEKIRIETMSNLGGTNIAIIVIFIVINFLASLAVGISVATK